MQNLQIRVKRSPAKPADFELAGGWRSIRSTSRRASTAPPHWCVRDYEHRRGEFLREAIAWHGAGRIAVKDHVVERPLVKL